MGVSECKLRLVKESFLQSVINQESSLLRSFCAFISAFVYTEISVVYFRKKKLWKEGMFVHQIDWCFLFLCKKHSIVYKKMFQKKSVYTDL